MRWKKAGKATTRACLAPEGCRRSTEADNVAGTGLEALVSVDAEGANYQAMSMLTNPPEWFHRDYESAALTN
jgi:hypothetical protein